MDDMMEIWMFEQMYPGTITGCVSYECKACEISWEQDADGDDNLYRCPQCGDWVRGMSVL